MEYFQSLFSMILLLNQEDLLELLADFLDATALLSPRNLVLSLRFSEKIAETRNAT